MAIKKIPYQTFCWVVGTTSFRTAQLNLKIEEQLSLLDEFYRDVIAIAPWSWDNDLQAKYYDFMQAKGFITGDAARRDKDAREKTSGLVDIGLITEDRLLTSAGEELLQISTDGTFAADNLLNINRDSFVYLKQLLKTSIAVGSKRVRPFIVLLKCLQELNSLSYKEFTYFVPLIKDADSCEEIIANIKAYREHKIKLEDIIFHRLMSMPNYQTAKEKLLQGTADEELVCLIGMNRKSRRYDRPYYELYKNLKMVFLDKENAHEALLTSVKAINPTTRALWKNLLFRTTSARVLRQDGNKAIAVDCPFLQCSDERSLKEVFFKYLHVFKAMATLLDYFDLNRRYFNITDTLVFEDGRIKLDVLPKYYFAQAIDGLFADAFTACDILWESSTLEDISDAFRVDMRDVYAALSEDLGIVIKNAEQAVTYIMDERYRRFNALIDKKFTDEILLELLRCFEERDDARIKELVTDEATVPTIFEYILGIIWYKVSERQGNILEFMKLSLEANLLPKTHAGGGNADIIYEYAFCSHYPQHDLLLEATLADGTNQRRMEMEPVSRHLGDYRAKSNNPFDYSLFISTYLDQNVVSDFRYRKIIPYKRDDKRILDMKIISLDTNAVKKIIEKGIKYSELYKVFDKYHKMGLDEDVDVDDWHENMWKEAAGEYKV